MKKITFLVLSYHTINFFRPIIKKIIARGHEIQILAIYELPFGAKEDGWNTKRVQWQRFEFSEIERFNPDTIVVFNGYFRPIHGAVQALKRKFNILLAEVAWFTQNDYIYIDRNIHHKSDIAQTISRQANTAHESIVNLYSHHLEEVVKKYAPGSRPPELEDNILNVVVPLQLERDTSILYASPYFKDMGSLVGYIANSIKDVNIIVKAHPKLRTDELEEHFNPKNYPGIKFVKETEHTMNDYAYHCDAVIGINSTSLMEAKLHEKPVFQLGKNVLRVQEDSPDKESLGEFIRKVRAKEPTDNALDIKSALLTMIANQVDFRNPPEWVIDKILAPVDQQSKTRTLEDLDERT